MTLNENFPFIRCESDWGYHQFDPRQVPFLPGLLQVLETFRNYKWGGGSFALDISGFQKSPCKPKMVKEIYHS